MKQFKFRIPYECQNGHPRFLFSSFSDGFDNTVSWGEKHPDCKCPTGSIGEGFHQSGDADLIGESVDLSRGAMSTGTCKNCNLPTIATALGIYTCDGCHGRLCSTCAGIRLHHRRCCPLSAEYVVTLRGTIEEFRAPEKNYCLHGAPADNFGTVTASGAPELKRPGLFDRGYRRLFE